MQQCINDSLQTCRNGQLCHNSQHHVTIDIMQR
jgi:hypothetical protein